MIDRFLAGGTKEPRPCKASFIVGVVQCFCGVPNAQMLLLASTTEDSALFRWEGRKEGKTEVSEGTPRHGLRVPVYSALLRSFYCPVVVAVFRGVLALSWSVWR